MSAPRRAYLDHASSSPLRPVALEAMLPFLEGAVGDPGRVHGEGRMTRVAVETAREAVAALFGARPREVIFTASVAEAVNAAIWGAVARAREQGSERPHVVTTAVEQAAVLESIARLPIDCTVVGVDRLGRFAADDVAAAITPTTALVSVQLANHEVGTVQREVPTIVAGARAAGALVHLDASAAAGHLVVDFAGLDADLCSLGCHSWGGPAGAAALLVRRGLRVPPLLVGGAQERARRAGLEDVAAIVGFGAAALELHHDGRIGEEARDARALTDRLVDTAIALDGVVRWGDPAQRLPHLVCIGVEGVEAEPVVLGLDQAGVAVHSGSSCSSELLEPSPVLAAMGVDAEHSLRLSVGWNSTVADVERFATVFPSVVARLRALRN